ncbi:hypothetical protein RchiOBHm_Chr5g0044111 [Rosa chinensis]|uniref:Uncharacterized protein n=1 Tax=Rosa chinensis TaxID=74649 RepID=A0A2P6QDH5_ROSCH|nr:hypothetical protein RchiOBHm_Chr5g0044111 [Rosa chinensis]
MASTKRMTRGLRSVKVVALSSCLPVFFPWWILFRQEWTGSCPEYGRGADLFTSAGDRDLKAAMVARRTTAGDVRTVPITVCWPKLSLKPNSNLGAHNCLGEVLDLGSKVPK